MTEYELMMCVSRLLNKPIEQVIQTPYITLLREITETYVIDMERLIGIFDNGRNDYN